MPPVFNKANKMKLVEYGEAHTPSAQITEIKDKILSILHTLPFLKA